MPALKLETALALPLGIPDYSGHTLGTPFLGWTQSWHSLWYGARMPPSDGVLPGGSKKLCNFRQAEGDHNFYCPYGVAVAQIAKLRVKVTQHYAFDGYGCRCNRRSAAQSGD